MLEYTTKELKGIRSVRLLQILQQQLLAVYLMPKYAGKTFEEFLKVTLVDNLDAILHDCIALAEMNERDIELVLSFATDKNGVAISTFNTNALRATEIADIVAAIFKEVANINFFFQAPQR